MNQMVPLSGLNMLNIKSSQITLVNIYERTSVCSVKRVMKDSDTDCQDSCPQSGYSVVCRAKCQAKHQKT